MLHTHDPGALIYSEPGRSCVQPRVELRVIKEGTRVRSDLVPGGQSQNDLENLGVVPAAAGRW